MKKFINLLFLLVILNLMILSSPLAKSYSLLPISYAENYINHNDNYNLIIKILKDVNKSNLIPYADYIDLKVIDTIPNDTENKIAFTLSLPQQVSFIAIYKKINNEDYKLQNCIDGLSTINNFYYYKSFLIIEQSDSNSSTDPTQREFFEVFFRKDTEYISVFIKNIYIEKMIKNDNDNIIKETETSSIDYLEGNIPKILRISTITKYKGVLSKLNNNIEFRETEKNTKKETYEWDPKKESFFIINLNS